MSKAAPQNQTHVAALVGIAACTAIVVGSTKIQLTPAGIFRGIDGRPANAPYWYIDGALAEPLIAAASARANDYVLDYDHQTLRAEKNGQPAPAAGWFKKLEWIEGEGLFGVDVEWTAAAQAAIDAKEYRYISPVIAYDKAGNVTGLLMAAITNYAAIDGMDEIMLAAASAQYNLSHTAALSQELPNMEALLEQLRWMLNLPVASTPEDILTNLTKLADMIKSDQGDVAAASCDLVGMFTAQRSMIASLSAAPATPDPAKFIAIGTLTELQTKYAALSAELNTTRLDELITGALKENRLLPSMESWARDFGTKDIAALSGYLKNAPVMPALAGLQSNTVDTGAGVAGLTESQAALCAAMGVSTEDFLKTLKAETPA
jgi:phage I-like protein